MNHLRQDLDRRAARFSPDRAAYEQVLRRASLRRARRRVTAGVTAFVVSAAAFAGLWAATHGSGAVPVATPTPAAVTGANGLRIGLSVHLPRGIGQVLADADGGSDRVWVAAPRALYTVDPLTGDALVTARPSWDPEAVRLAVLGEGTIWAVWKAHLAAFDSAGPAGSSVDLSALGSVVDAVANGAGGTWVTASNGSRWRLVRVDPNTGDAVGRAVVVGQGRHSIVTTDSYVFVAGPPGAGPGPAFVRVDPRDDHGDEVPLGTNGALAVVGDRVWTLDGDTVECIDVISIDPCGEVRVERGAALASDGNRLWVLSMTGSKDPSIYEPDPSQPATVTLLDGQTGAILAPPVRLPDVTPASISAGFGHAWVGFFDTGLLVRIDVCPDAACQSSPLVVRLRVRLEELTAAIRMETAHLAELEALQGDSGSTSVESQIRHVRGRIHELEGKYRQVAGRLDRATG